MSSASNKGGSLFSSRRGRSVTPSTSTSAVGAASTSKGRISIGGPIRLNDLINDDDEYGFVEEAVEASAMDFPDGVESSTAAQHDTTIVGCQAEVRAREMRIPSHVVHAPSMSSSVPPESPPKQSVLADMAHLSASSLSVLTAEGPSGPNVERVSLGGHSVCSNESGGEKEKTDSSSSGGKEGKEGKEKSKGIGSFIDKAKHKLNVARGREKRSVTPEVVSETTLQCEAAPINTPATPHSTPLKKKISMGERLSSAVGLDAMPVTLSVESLPQVVALVVHHLREMPFPTARLYITAVLAALTLILPGFLSGFLWGSFLSSLGFLFFFVSDPNKKTLADEAEERVRKSSEDFRVEAVVEQAAEALEEFNRPAKLVKYKGWMNELQRPARYDPSTYHVNSCRCVLVRLDNNMLRISRPTRKMLMHAFHNDPTLSQPLLTMNDQDIFDLTGATVSLRPRRLARRRWWSRKYPIYIRFAPKEGEEKERSMKRSISMHPAKAIERSDERRSFSVDEATPPPEGGKGGGANTGNAPPFAANINPLYNYRRRDVRALSEDIEADEISLMSTAYDSDDSEDEVEIDGKLIGIARRTRSSTEIFASSEREESLYGSKKRKPRGIYLFARAAREKERWFHILREAAASTRLSRAIGEPIPIPGASAPVPIPLSTSSSKQHISSKNVTPNGPSPAGTPYGTTPKGSRKRLHSTGDLLDQEIDYPTPDREYLLYRTNRKHFESSMSEAIGFAISMLTEGAFGVAASAGAGASTSGGVSTTSLPQPLHRGYSMDGESASIDLGAMKWKAGTIPEGSADLVASVNAIAARIFFDFCRDEYWSKQVKEKLQTKLATVHLPYFIEMLELSSLDLGTAAPHFESVYSPTVDEWGLWVDFEMRYRGGIRLALETRVNLLKLQYGAAEADTDRVSNPGSARPSRYSDEELPESPEDSPDEDFGAKLHGDKEKEMTTRERAGSKIVSFVESAARTSFFQKVAKVPKVAKVITDISSTRLILNVEIESIEGTMTVNLPGPPSDRIWYAFRKRPKVSIRAVPQVGDRSVDVSAVSDWIESRLKLLIEKNLVCPNMDDVIIPVMSGNELLNMGYNK